MAEIRLNRTEAVHDHLPMVCMVCDRKATVRRPKRFWRNTQAPILLPGVIVRRGEWVTVDMPLCDRHRNHYLRPLWVMLGGMGGLTILGFLVFGLAALGMFGGYAAAAGANNPKAGAAIIATMIGGAVLLLAGFAGLVVGILVVQFRLIRPTHIDDRTITLCNISNAFVTAMAKRRGAIHDVDAGDYWNDRSLRRGPDGGADDLDGRDEEPAEALPAEPEPSGFSWYGLVAVIFLALFALPCGLLSLIVPPAAYALLGYGVLLGLAGAVWVRVLAAWDGRSWLLLVPCYAVYYAVGRPARAALPLTAELLGAVMFGVAAALLFQSGGAGILPTPPPAPAPLALANDRQPASPADLDGLIAYWNLDEADGVRAADQSGQGLDGAVEGPRRAPGVKGNCLYFNGKGDCVDYGRSPKFNFGPGEAFTYAGWVQTRTRNGAVLSQRNSADGGAVIDLLMRNGSLEWMVRNDAVPGWGQDGTVRSTKPISDGKWHHFAGTRTADGRVELTIDGVWQGQAGGPLSNGRVTTDLRFLGTERYWTQTRWYEYPHFEGYLDEVCVYKRALKPDEIKALAGK